MRRAALALALSALLGGCSLAPPHVRPPLASPIVYPPDARPDGGQRHATEIGWRDFFTDPRLRALIGTALENNRDLRIAVARIEEARGLYRIQDAARYPALDGSASATRTRTGSASFGLAGGGVGTGVGGGAGLGIDGITQDRFQVGVAVTAFELDFWGRLRSLSEAARAQYLASTASANAFRLSLIRDVATSYLTARETAERLALAEATLASRREGLRIARLRLDAGVTSALDYRQAETLLTQAETQLAALQLTRAQAVDQIVALVGRPVTAADLPDPLAMARQTVVRDIGAGLPSDLLDNRPDIIAAEEQLRAARANIGAARAAFFPRISLTGSAGFASTELDTLVGKTGFNWSIGPTLTLPIFDWGARRGDLTVARARQDIAVATYERTVQTAFREVADALAGRRWLADQIAAQGRAVTAQRALASLARARYLNGVAQYLEVLDAERNLFEAEQAMVALRRTELANLVSLYIALGGGLAEDQTATGR